MFKPLGRVTSATLLLLGLAGVISPAVQAADANAEKIRSANIELLTSANQWQDAEAEINRAREAAFKADLAQQTELLAAAKQALATEKARAQALKEQFDSNDKALQEAAEALRLRTGNLGEMFGVVRQVAGDLHSVLDTSLTRIDGDYPADLNALAAAKRLPAIPELEELWHTFQLEVTRASEIRQLTAPVTLLDGTTAQQAVVRFGTFNVVTDPQAKKPGYLLWDDELKQLSQPAQQPDEANLLSDYPLSASNGFAAVALDPSRGALLGLSMDAPTWKQRIQQGGEVGYLILVIGAAGVLLALWRIAMLGLIGRGVSKQRANMLTPTADNALGRVLLVAKDIPLNHDAELIEARLNEAVLRELPALERGQSIIKLLAGIAPLLGLLGTVTGMIATFQAITTYGTGDAKLMAAGISQALITTVLGLVVAIPLLLMHNWVASRSRALVQVLDEQSAGLMAEALEKSNEKSHVA
ncbi:hypothetical protein CN03_09865 [Thalassolituus oleivorans]|uniref:MotA/TolQ/ExbB proton channel family protein n=1 Tax=Thalassolituus oleivorans TaxID=187493 RepID=UPI00094935FB|nr:MotA/TolQ/ExbB proton channel family protein [Thalassolituus oleivorans]APR67209.1 hypothetical protein CN03_09865 [Thalassolituus oleivorans]